MTSLVNSATESMEEGDREDDEASYLENGRISPESGRGRGTVEV